MISRGTLGWGATEEERKPWRTRAVADAYGRGELDTRKCGPAVKGRTIHDCERETYKSPGLRPLLAEKGAWDSTMSSIPPLAGFRSSTLLNTAIEPSAPPPLDSKYRIVVNLEDNEWSLRIFVVQGEPDSIMESDPEGRMSVFATSATIEEVGLDVLKNREESTAGFVLYKVPARTGNMTVQNSCQ